MPCSRMRPQIPARTPPPGTLANEIPHATLNPILTQVLTDAQKQKAFDDLDLDGCLDLANCPNPATGFQFVAWCDVAQTGNLTEWRGTWNDLASCRAKSGWQKREVIARCLHHSLTTAV